MYSYNMKNVPLDGCEPQTSDGPLVDNVMPTYNGTIERFYYFGHQRYKLFSIAKKMKGLNKTCQGWEPGSIG